MEPEGTATTHGRAPSFIIKRPRLTKLLDESEARIILLVAPAGYGKTTLAREWLAGWGGPVAWFQATAASVDIAALSAGIADALDSAQGEGSGSIASRLAPSLTGEQRPEELARRVAAGWTGREPKLLLAIDDYHHVASSPAAADFIGELVRLLPITFVITSRTRPHWVAPRFTVYGQAFELGVNDLAMTDPEAEEVLRCGERPPSVSSIELARGWPAIVGLVARTKTANLPDVIPSRLYAFLAADLVGSTSISTQEALAIFALAGVHDLPTAHLLLGRDSAKAIRESESRGLLTLVGDQLTLHPLLSSFLVNRLHADTEKLASTIEWLAPALIDSRRWTECLAVAEAVPKNLFPIAGVLERAFEELLSDGLVTTVNRWCELARRDHVDAPIVDLAESEVALLAGDYEKARGLASRAARSLGPAELRTRAHLVAARAAHLANDLLEANESFREAEENASSNGMRAIAIWGQFLVAFEEESEGLRAALNRYVDSGDGSIEHELRSAQGRLLLAVAECKFSEALDASVRGVALLSLPADASTRLATLNQHIWVLTSAGRYADALAVSDRALVEADTSCVDFAVTHLQLSRATALIGLRRFSSAQQLLSTLSRRLEEEPNLWSAANLTFAQAKLQISLGDLAHAEAVLPSALNSLCASQRSECEGYRGLIAAAIGRVDEAAAWAERSETTSTHVEGLVLPAITRAVVAVQTDRPTIISEQFEIALASGLYDPIVIGCRACPRLVAHISRTSRQSELLAILSKSNDAALARASGVRLPRYSRSVSGLSPRELEVYDLIVQGRTNREISQILFIAESTTKVHVRHILEKLGVRSRVDAVRAWRLDENQATSDS
jgi:ATP/maltotriose-dependent transcriptional regulator MalT